ncbi:uncharacterized protein LOC135170188 [Diachasmimorpha longicaudata]|uniref:uncharacterized protein LOC135170188 n=1 Tax=Diachasmimorpha longicaudata TaxID=58733 RepID=UPI0030B8A2EB
MSGLCGIWNRQFDQHSSDDNYRWAMRIPRLVLGALGIWPEMGNSGIKFVICLAIYFVFIVVPRVIIMFDEEEDVRNRFLNISTSVYDISIATIAVLFYCKSHGVRSMLGEVRDIWKSPLSREDTIVLHYYARFSMKILTVYGIIEIVVYLDVLIDINASSLAAIIKGEQWSANHYWYRSVSSNVLINVLWAAACSIAVGLSWIFFDGTLIAYIVLISHTSAQLKMLGNRISKYQGRINHSSDGDTSASMYGGGIECNCLKCIVETQVQIWNFLKKVEDHFQMALLMILFVAILYGCMGGFLAAELLIKQEYVKALVELVWSLTVYVGITLSCWVVDICQENSRSLGEVAYSIQWTTKNPKISRDLLFIIRQSAIPLKLTVGKCYTPSLILVRKSIFTTLSYTSSLLATSNLHTNN